MLDISEANENLERLVIYLASSEFDLRFKFEGGFKGFRPDRMRRFEERMKRYNGDRDRYILDKLREVFG